MMLNSDQEDEVRKRVIEKYGEESVKQMDLHFMALNDIRIGCRDAFEFLDKVKEKYSEHDTELLLAAILYGMKQGELGYQYHLKQQNLDMNGKPLPMSGHAS